MEQGRHFITTVAEVVFAAPFLAGLTSAQMNWMEIFCTNLRPHRSKNMGSTDKKYWEYESKIWAERVKNMGSTDKKYEYGSKIWAERVKNMGSKGKKYGQNG